MNRYRFIYLLLIGFGVFFYIAFVGYFSYYFLLVILVLPLLSLIYLIGSLNLTKLEFKVENKKIKQGEQVEILVIRDKLGLGAIKFKIDDQKYFLNGNQEQLRLSFKHCGGRNLIIENYYQYDCLNLFAIKKKCHYEIPLTIYPQEIEINFEKLQRSLPKEGEEVYAINQKGDDPTEIYDIHKYQEGDSLKNIHWKLSAKYQEILVKENALALGATINIYCIFDNNDDHNDLIFAYLDAFCTYLLTKKINFLLSSKEIKSKQEYDEMFKYLLWNKEYHPDVSKYSYEFLIDYHGIRKAAGG